MAWARSRNSTSTLSSSQNLLIEHNVTEGISQQNKTGEHQEDILGKVLAAISSSSSVLEGRNAVEGSMPRNDKTLLTT